MIIFLMLTLIIFSINIYIGEQLGFCRENIRINGMLFIMYACLLFGVFIALTYIVMKDSQMEQERIQAQNLKEYMLQLEQLYDSISSFRHDYINILLSLEEGIRSDDVVVIKDVYEKLVKPTGEFVRNDQYIFGKLRNLRVNEVKSILVAKIMQASAQKIDVKLEIEEVIDAIYMDLLDFCRVFSVLIDNAIEAAMETEQPYISIALIQDDKVQCIMIENNSREQKINLQEIFEKGYSSKGKNRGIGLYTVQQLLSKNKYATLETSYESDIFMQALTLKENIESLPTT